MAHSSLKNPDTQTLHGLYDAIDRVQAMIEFDITGHIQHANDVFLQVMGYRLDHGQVGRAGDGRRGEGSGGQEGRSGCADCCGAQRSPGGREGGHVDAGGVMSTLRWLEIVGVPAIVAAVLEWVG